MLNKNNRLTSDRDFKTLFRKNKRFYGQGINMVMAANGLKISRFGFVVGTKVDKRAVVRNKIQRQMREVIRLRINDIKPGFDCAFITNKKILEADFDSITAIVVGLLKKSKLLV